MTSGGFPHDQVLLIGGSGMLGRAWRELLIARGIAFVAPSHAELDVTDPAHLDAFINRPGMLVIHCAAWTNVDGAETQPEAAEALNATAPAMLASRCAASRATLVHYSTDYVFDGSADMPWPTDAPRDPQSVYGRTKAQGEEAIEQSGCDCLILRTSWLYAPWGNNFVRTITRLGRSKPTLRVVSDQQGRPTSCQYLAQASLALIEKEARGIYHVADGGQCSWYEFACEIIRLDDSSCVVEPCTTAEFPRPARRPAYSVLDLSKTQALLERPAPPWQDNLASVMRQLETLT